MSEINQVINNIKEAFEKIHKGPAVYKKKILKYIFEKWKDIPDTELYDLIGEMYKSNPQNFMKYIHSDFYLDSFLLKKFSKQYGVEKLREMNRYIFENFQVLLSMHLELMNLPKYTFYCQPKKVKKRPPLIKPDIAYVVENWITNIDPSTKMDTHLGFGRGYSAEIYYLAPGINTFVEIASIVFAKSYGSKMYNADKQVIKLDIYTNNEEYVRAIAKEINAIWDDGMIPHLNFEKLVEEFGVGKEDAMATWNRYIVELSDQVGISPSAQPLKPIKIRGLKEKHVSDSELELCCCIIPMIILLVIILVVLYSWLG